MSRHQPFGCDNAFTSSAVEAFRSGTRGVARRRLVHHAVDAAESGAAIEAALEDLIAQVFGDRDAVLDDAAVHVGDVQRAVGRTG